MFKLCHWGSLLWPLIFSSGERPRALWALLFYNVFGMTRSWNNLSFKGQMPYLSHHCACAWSFVTEYCTRCKDSKEHKLWNLLFKKVLHFISLIFLDIVYMLIFCKNECYNSMLALSQGFFFKIKCKCQCLFSIIFYWNIVFYNSGQQRSRMLATLFKDERCQKLPAYNILEKM